MDEVIPKARQTLAKELAEPLDAEIQRLTSHRQQLLKAGDGTAVAEAAMLDRYRVMLESWDVVLDGIGFLAVNVRG
jgi:ATP-dependent helicase HepA